MDLKKMLGISPLDKKELYKSITFKVENTCARCNGRGRQYEWDDYRKLEAWQIALEDADTSTVERQEIFEGLSKIGNECPNCSGTGKEQSNVSLPELIKFIKEIEQ